MRRALVATIVTITLAAACNGNNERGKSDSAPPPDAPELIAASSDALDGVEGRVSLEGTVVVEGDVMQICERFGHSPPSCLDGVEVRGLATSAIPRLAKNGGRLWSWPPLVVVGTLDAGVLMEAELPTMFRIDVVGARVEHAAVATSPMRSSTLIAAGQRIGIVRDGWQPPADESWILRNKGGAKLGLTAPECPDGADCIGGYLRMATDSLEPGVYAVSSAPSQLRDLRVTVRVEEAPEQWLPPCCIGDPAHPGFLVMLDPPQAVQGEIVRVTVVGTGMDPGTPFDVSIVHSDGVGIQGFGDGDVVVGRDGILTFDGSIPFVIEHEHWVEPGAYRLSFHSRGEPPGAISEAAFETDLDIVKAVASVAYRHGIYVHCGIERTFFDGEMWVPVEADESHNPPAGWDRNREVGVITVVGPGRAEFVADSGGEVELRVATSEERAAFDPETDRCE